MRARFLALVPLKLGIVELEVDALVAPGAPREVSLLEIRLSGSRVEALPVETVAYLEALAIQEMRRERATSARRP